MVPSQSSREGRTFSDLVQALVTRFPQASEAEVHRLVEDARQRFRDARIQTYVPTLVEREVREQLRGLHPRIASSWSGSFPAPRRPLAVKANDEVPLPKPLERQSLLD
jgi:CRISPR/Cas system-associated exonuclease Cas4 (RecB family)